MLRAFKMLILAGLSGLVMICATASAAGAPKIDLDYNVVLEGDLAGDEVATNSVRSNKNTPIWFMRRNFTLGAFFAGDVYAKGNGTECFNNQPYNGSLQLVERRDGRAQATFWFTGNTSDNTGTEVLYRLTLVTPEMEGWGGSFPPLDDFLTVSSANWEWEMRPDAKGKLKNFACRGTGSDAVLTITLTPLP